MIEKNAKIYVAGHRGLVGSAIYKNLQEKGYTPSGEGLYEFGGAHARRAGPARRGGRQAFF